MRVTVRFFAILRDAAGTDVDELDLPQSASVSAAAEQIAARWPATAAHLPRVAFAVNRQYVRPDHVLRPGDELALIPPVSGG